MTTSANTGTATIRIPDMWVQGQELLDEWDTVIEELNATLGRLNAARHDLTEAEEELTVIEARAVLEVSGGNAETRRAQLTLLLAEHPTYQRTAARVKASQEGVREAERHLSVLKERGRLLRAATALIAGQRQ
jgi:hypothetical protein